MKVHGRKTYRGGGVDLTELLSTSGGGRQTMDYIAMDHKSLSRHVADITAKQQNHPSSTCAFYVPFDKDTHGHEWYKSSRNSVSEDEEEASDKAGKINN